MNKLISAFLAQNRARNDASNRDEFLYSTAQKRRRLAEEDQDSNISETAISSCARTDAKPIDRDVQMKYDIARNEEGPLRRTVKSESEEPSNKNEKHLGLDERFKNIEAHLSVRYGMQYFLW